MRYLSLSILVFILPLLVVANDPEQQFQQANELYKGNSFSSAIEIYKDIEAEGYRSPELYFNLGNAYYKINEPGKSVLYYERALMIATAESRGDIKYNLELIRKRLPDEIEVLSPFFLKRWKDDLQQFASEKGWTIVGLVFFWMGIGGILVWLTGKSRAQKKLGFLAGLSLLIFSSFPFYMAIESTAPAESSKLAVIMTDEIAMRSAPDEVSNLIMTLHEGTSVELLDQIGKWYKVKLLNGEQGWLPIKVLEKV